MNAKEKMANKMIESIKTKKTFLKRLLNIVFNHVLFSGEKTPEE